MWMITSYYSYSITYCTDSHTRTHTHTHAHTRTHTHTHTHVHKQSNTKPLAAASAVMPTQWTSTRRPVHYSGNSFRSRTSKDVPCLTKEGVDTWSPTWTFTYYARYGELVFILSHRTLDTHWYYSWMGCFPPVDTRPPGFYSHSWVIWSKVSYSRKQ